MNDIEHLEQLAIDAAINLHWKQAIVFNNQILKMDEKNDCAFLRLGFIYLQTKDLPKAKKYYSKALKLQPRSSVALQNLERIKVLEKTKQQKGISDQVAFDPDLFMEVVGKTKMVLLSNLGQKSVLARLTTGQSVLLKIKKRRVEVRTKTDDYIGTLPDDVSRRLIFFFKAKSDYLTFIKESTITRVVVFIREEKKGKTVTNQVSFPNHIQKIENTVSGHAEEKEEDAGDDQDDHTEDTWEKMVQDNQSQDEKELLIDVQRDDLEDEE